MSTPREFVCDDIRSEIQTLNDSEQETTKTREKFKVGSDRRGPLDESAIGHGLKSPRAFSTTCINCCTSPTRSKTYLIIWQTKKFPTLNG